MKQTKLLDPKSKLISIIGEDAFKTLLNGGVLKIWRASSPHNYYIQSLGSNKYIWHSKSEWSERKIPDQSLFIRTAKSSNNISMSLNKSEVGCPEGESLSLDPKLIKKWLKTK